MTTDLTNDISARRATGEDRVDLENLAALDSARALTGEILIAAVADEPQAAIEVATGATVADPFRPTAHLVELLELRAARLRQPARTDACRSETPRAVAQRTT